MQTRTVIVAIHGILTRQTDPSWPDRFDAWCCTAAPGVRVLKKEYGAGPFPRWNALVENRRLAAGIAAELELFYASAPTAVWFVAHSNGALIALETVRRLVRNGRTVAGLILIGTACDADLARTGVLGWLRQAQLGAALAYCSPDDTCLPGRKPGAGRLWSTLYSLLAWPYGSLGRTGWLLRGRPAEMELENVLRRRVLVRWFKGGHSGYFAPQRIEFTFRQILQDIAGPDTVGPVPSPGVGPAPSPGVGPVPSPGVGPVPPPGGAL